jgi:hypothetical protein
MNLKRRHQDEMPQEITSKQYCYYTCDVTPLARLKVIAEESQRKGQSVRHDPGSSRRELYPSVGA